MKKLNKKGFTIVELVIVIAVIAILAAVLIPTFATVIRKANQNAAMQASRNAFTEYLADDYKHVVEGGNYIIIKDAYAFKAENGSFNATAYDYKTTATTSITDDITLADSKLNVLDTEYNVIEASALDNAENGSYAILVSTNIYKLVVKSA